MPSKSSTIRVLNFISAVLCLSGSSKAAHLGETVEIPPPVCDRRLQWTCSNGACIPLEALCDGRADCSDGSDERLTCQHIACPPYTFRCNYGACIPTSQRCNGVPDCADSSDEDFKQCSYKYEEQQTTQRPKQSRIKVGEEKTKNTSGRKSINSSTAIMAKNSNVETTTPSITDTPAVTLQTLAGGVSITAPSSSGELSNPCSTSAPIISLIPSLVRPQQPGEHLTDVTVGYEFSTLIQPQSSTTTHIEQQQIEVDLRHSQQTSTLPKAQLSNSNDQNIEESTVADTTLESPYEPVKEVQMPKANQTVDKVLIEADEQELGTAITTTQNSVAPGIQQWYEKEENVTEETTSLNVNNLQETSFEQEPYETSHHKSSVMSQSSPEPSAGIQYNPLYASTTIRSVPNVWIPLTTKPKTGETGAYQHNNSITEIENTQGKGKYRPGTSTSVVNLTVNSYKPTRPPQQSYTCTVPAHDPQLIVKLVGGYSGYSYEISAGTILSVGTHISYTCRPGYTLSGAVSARCTVEGWSSYQTKCIRNKFCSSDWIINTDCCFWYGYQTHCVDILPNTLVYIDCNRYAEKWQCDRHFNWKKVSYSYSQGGLYNFRIY